MPTASRVPTGGFSDANIVFGQATVSTATECVQLTTETWEHTENDAMVVITIKDAATFYIGTGTVGTSLASTGLKVYANNTIGTALRCKNPSLLRVDSAGSSKTVTYCIFDAPAKAHNS